MGGCIMVESQEDVGSTFMVYIKAYKLEMEEEK